MILSILIPSLHKRSYMLAKLLINLHGQILDIGMQEFVEVLVNVDGGEKTTGQKRNELIEQAKGEYVIQADDDDTLPDYYVKELLEACKSDADCFAMSGIMWTNGENKQQWFIGKDLNYCTHRDEQGKEYYHRYTNHITGLKRSIAAQIKFPHKSFAEDHEWATALHNSGLLKTEFAIRAHPMYIYNFNSKK